ncbi:MAG: hypothetical protein ACI39U_03200 [Candidatus Cryptobacteroides sp.]
MKASVKYIVRAVKYFCWFLILFSLLIGILVLTKFVPADINTMFIKGWVSVAEIAGVFLVFSAVYPKFGYVKRRLSIPGEWAEVSTQVKEFFSERGDYEIESEEEGKICYRSKSRAVRIARLWEDRITVDSVLGGVELEGPAKDLNRIVSAFEYRLRGE